MKKVILSVVAAFVSLGAVAQMSRYFEYDRDKVSSIMETINESTVTSGGSEMVAFFPDDTISSRKKYFWYGFLGGGLGCLAGMGSGYLLGEVLELGATAAWISIATGSLVGTIIPQAIAGHRTQNPKNSGAAVLGSITALGATTALLVILFAIGGG
jgi:hypothetical protein